MEETEGWSGGRGERKKNARGDKRIEEGLGGEGDVDTGVGTNGK